ncbi:MAG: hypothetical protein Q9191_008238, partial [Dirinaria sp. TL-2023a]
MKEATGGQSLASIYSVFDGLKPPKGTGNKSAGPSSSSTKEAAPSTSTDPTSSSAQEAHPNTSGTNTTESSTPNAEAETFKSYGNAAMRKEDFQGAIDNYTKAINLCPTNAIYLSNRSAAYSQAKKHLQASTDAEMAVAADPKYTKGWSRLGFARLALDDAKGSVEAYEKGIEYEGGGGTETMKMSLEKAKARLEAREKEEADKATSEEADIDDESAKEE